MIIAFIDDNQIEQTQNLELFMDAFQTMNIPITKIDRFSNGETFLEHWTTNRYDLVVLDILMGSLSGIAVAKKIREQNQEVRIVFCSHSNEFAYESYMLNASYYMQKPVTYESINQMILRLDMKDYKARRFIILPNKKRLILRDMIYAESSQHSIIVHLKSGELLMFYATLQQFMEILSPHEFFLQCNKGNIINMHEIISFQKDAFIMSNQHTVSVSRRKQREVQTLYHDFLFQTLRKDLA